VKSNLTLWRWWRLDAIGAGILIALSLVIYVCGFYPLMSSHKDYEEKQAALKAQREHSARLESTLQALQKRLAVVSQSLASCSLNLKPAANLNNQLSQISALASASGLAIDDVRTDQAVAESHSDAYPVTLAGKGTYRACTVFLNRLRKAFPDTTVLSLELTGNAGDADGNGKFNFRLRWHAAPKPIMAAK
jgi:Tfp pilus assembly protein PilO